MICKEECDNAIQNRAMASQREQWSEKDRGSWEMF